VWRNNRVGTPNATLRTLVQKVQQRQADMGKPVVAVSARNVRFGMELGSRWL